jgi:hypothetical protein
MNSHRYSYVRNNPMKYTDPSGYLVGGWYEAGAALFYIGIKNTVQHQIDNGLNPGMIFIMNKE